VVKPVRGVAARQFAMIGAFNLTIARFFPGKVFLCLNVFDIVH
jgi:hypothetical protein